MLSGFTTTFYYNTYHIFCNAFSSFSFFSAMLENTHHITKILYIRFFGQEVL